METNEIPKRIKISQSIIMLLLYIIACCVASGSRSAINVVTIIYMIVTAIIALFHYVHEEKCISFSNLCLAGLIYIIFVSMA